MKSLFSVVAAAFAMVVAADLADLVNPDDVMLRRPEKKAAAPAVAAPAPETPKTVEKPAPVVEKPAPAVEKPAPAAAAPAPETPKAAEIVKEQPAESAPKKAKKRELTGREAVITAERTDYDRKEGVILFDRNVFVDDEQYQMHADRIFVFLEGTNDLKRIVALGNVAITNEDKTATCSRAVYVRSLGKIVMYGDESKKAVLHEEGKKGGAVNGDRITFWLNSEQVEIEGTIVTMPGGALKGGNSPKDMLKMAR